jgi:hypothetical protein
MAYLVRANGETIALWPMNGSSFTLVEMQVIVGGFIEVIATPSCLFIVNDAPRLRLLEPNYHATAALATAGAPHILFGDVVVCHHQELE